MKKWNNVLQKLCHNKIVFTFIWSVCINLIIECLSRKSILKGVVHMGTAPFVFLFNSMIIVLTVSICYLFKKRRFVRLLVTTLWLIIGVLNCVLLSFRKTPFTGNDFLLISDAFKIIHSYIDQWGIILIIAAIVLVVAGLVYLAIKSPAVAEEIQYVKTVGAIGIVWMTISAMLWIGLVTGVIASRFGNITTAYKEYGFVYCFVNSIIDNGIKKPVNYETEGFHKINEIVEEPESVIEKPVEEKKQYPNIIFVQLESFMNPYLLKDVTFSENPIPNFLKLLETYPSGYLSVPSFGAGTANTEFEVITGMNLDDFGTGEYPYKTILKNNPCESMAYDLKKYGYTSHMLHNNDGTFYNRYHVAANLGFDTFQSIEFMEVHEKNPIGWAKDNMLVKEIEKTLDSTENQDYIYAISVQGHGDYPQDEEELEALYEQCPVKYRIDFEGFENTEEQVGFSFYLSQLKEMDEFVGNLVRAMERRDEETILVFYGDHLPGFNLEADSLTTQDLYQSQYVIWSNSRYGFHDADIEAFQLSSHIMKQLEMDEGVINRFHQNYQQEEDYLEMLTLLEYDILYGEKKVYDNQILYEPTDIQMGLEPLHVTNLYNFNDRILVEGYHFNNYCFVTVNGKEYETVCVNPHTLAVPGASLSEKDVVVITQHGEDGIVLSSTEEIIYHQE